MKKTLAILGAIAALVGGSATIASAVNTPTPTPEVLSTTNRDWCIETGTGAPKSLWLVAATNKCPKGYWGPTTLSSGTGTGVVGPAGPVGPAGKDGKDGAPGKDGASGFVITSGKTTVSKDGVYEIRVKGLPKITAQQLLRSVEAVDVDVLRRDVNGDPFVTTVIKGAPVQDGTDWIYTLDVAGIKGASETIKVDVIAVAPVA